MSEETQFDASARRLCPDGACVGLIGADGRCSECGRAGEPPPVRAAGASPAVPAETPPEATLPMAAGAPDGGDGGFDANRKLCPDGSCVGVIGSDGKCNVCGRSESEEG